MNTDGSLHDPHQRGRRRPTDRGKHGYPQRVVANDDGLSLIAETYTNPDVPSIDADGIALMRNALPTEPRAPLEPPDLDAIREHWGYAGPSHVAAKEDIDALLAHIEAQQRRIAELGRNEIWPEMTREQLVERVAGLEEQLERQREWQEQVIKSEQYAAEQQSEIDRLRELLGASHTVLTDADSITSLVAYRHHRGRCDKGHPWELPSDVVDDLKATSTRARGLSERIEAVLSERPK